MTTISLPLPLLLVVLLSLIACVPRATCAAEPLSPYITSSTVLTDAPFKVTDIQNAGDGSQRLFIVGKEGVIRILKNGTLLPTAFLNLTGRVSYSDERGLLGLAFPPDYASKNCFYVCYSTPAGRTAVSRFRLTNSPNVADVASEEILFTINNSNAYHNGGQIAFGPDGYLYISTGDNGMTDTSQDLRSLNGKILRIDVEHANEGHPYTIPPTNPYAGSSEYAPEILCRGLRNPWRFSFDPVTGDLYVGDVGENLREEIDFIPAQALNGGINFGWPIKEGTLIRSDPPQEAASMLDPVFEYDRSVEGCVIGGCVYGGANPRLQGFYLFGDYSTGRIWAMDCVSKETRLVLKTPHNITTFGQDEVGNIYYASTTGKLHAIDAPDTLPPPGFPLPPGTYPGEVSLVIETEVPNAIIRFTTDGSIPDENSPAYTPGSFITLTTPGQVHAMTFRAGFLPSAVAGGSYNLCPLEVEFDPPQTNEPFIDTVPVSLSCETSGVEIFYTIDGSEPSSGSSKYIPGHPILINKQSVIKARAYKTGWETSGVSQAVYYLQVAAAAWVNPWVDLDEPVDLMSETSGAVIHYTLDGTLPTTTSPVWTAPRFLPPGTNVKTLSTKGEIYPTPYELVVSQISSTPVVFQKLFSTYLSPDDVVCMPDGTVYAAMDANIYLIADGTATPMIPGYPYGTNFTSITLTTDSKIAAAQGSIYGINKYSPPEFSTSTGVGTFSQVWDTVAEPEGKLVYTSLFNNKIARIESAGYDIPVAGTGATGSADGPAAQATFNGPNGIARDPSGRIFVSERYGNRIRVISTDAQVTTYAGNGVAGWVDGPTASARFDRPGSMAMDRIGNLYLSDSGSRIRKITPNGFVSTLRGPIKDIDGSTIHRDVVGINASGLAVDDNGVIYVAGDYNVSRVIQVDWDNDGIPDVTETQLGPPFIVGIDDRNVDSDGDRFSNAAERIAGTNPFSAPSKPVGPSVRKTEENHISLHFPMSPGGTRQLEYSDDMITWKSTGVAEPGELESFTARCRLFPSVPARFYRVREQR